MTKRCQLSGSLGPSRLISFIRRTLRIFLNLGNLFFVIDSELLF